MSAHRGGGLYVRHTDNGSHGFRTKVLSFAYYFHRQPRRFSGGELLLHDENAATFTRIESQHNSNVLFPAGCVHEIGRSGVSQSSEPPDARSSTSSSHARHAFTTQKVKATGMAHSTTMKRNTAMAAA